MTPTCSECRFLQRDADQPLSVAGQCRAAAPASIAVDGRLCASWPDVRPEHWCGQFEAPGDMALPLEIQSRKHAATPQGLATCLRTLIDKAWDVTILPASAGPVDRAIGWHHKGAIYLRLSTFRKAIGNGLRNHDRAVIRQAAATLARAGFLTASDVDRKNYVRYVPGGVGKMNCYALSMSRFRPE